MRVLASFKDCPVSDRKQFPHSSCIIPISVGQSVHEGKKFIAMMSLINRSFGKCTILIDDTIQWYTMKILDPELSNEVLYKRAKLFGTEWLARNQTIINNMSIETRILRWEDFSKSDEFAAAEQTILATYQKVDSYKQAIELNIQDFLTRSEAKGNVFDFDCAAQLCRAYLLEECACMLLWSRYDDYHFEVYPTGRNKAMTYTYKHFIEPVNPEILRSVSIRFKKKYPQDVSRPQEMAAA